MEFNIELYIKKINSLFNQPDLASFIKIIRPEIEELQNFRFYLSNPIFDLIILCAFLILAKSWGFRKSFSYCAVVTSILYLTTKATAYLSFPIEDSQILYGDILKFLAVIIVTLITIYYFFIKNK